jgi:hypothetical protein
VDGAAAADGVSAGLVILTPVLGRPHRVAPLLESVRASTPAARVLFIPDPDDGPERFAIREAGAEELPVAGGYAAKINAGVAHTSEPLVFIGADDLTFQPGWLEAATAKLRREVEVVGVNDLIPRRSVRAGHATHFLMTRAYAQRPALGCVTGPLFEGYDHSFTDDELIATARKRGAYAYAPAAHVQHHHPMAGGDDDDIYRKGRARFAQDRRLFQRRAKLWTGRRA